MPENNDNALNQGQDGDKYQGFTAYTEEPINGSEKPADNAGKSSKQADGQDDKKAGKAAEKAGDTPDDDKNKTGDKAGDDDNADDPSDKRRSPRRFEKRISRLTKRSKENGERAEKAERELQELRSQLEKYKTQESRPRSEDFNSPEEFETALEKWSREQGGKKPDAGKKKPARTAEQEEFEDALADVMDIFEENSDQYEDFKEVVFSDKVTFTPPMVIALSDTDDPTAIAYHLAKNPDEAARIAQLSPVRQAKEIGKLEAKLSAEQTKNADSGQPAAKATAKTDDASKRQSKAPRPIDPVKGSDAGDKDIEDMSFAEFEQKRAQQSQGKKKFW